MYLQKKTKDIERSLVIIWIPSLPIPTIPPSTPPLIYNEKQLKATLTHPHTTNTVCVANGTRSRILEAYNRISREIWP